MDPNAFKFISYGMYVVSSFKEGKLNGQIANTVFQVTAEPPMMAVSINCRNLTNEFIKCSKKFSIAVLSEKTPITMIGTFGFKCGRQVDKFSGIKYQVCSSGNPKILDYNLAHFDLEVVQSIELGSHTLFIGKVVESEVLAEGQPMTYDFYHTIKGGKTQQNAPTYIQKEKPMKKYTCTVCGYEYDPDVGDPDNGIKPGTSFESLPDDWICPVCGAAKDAFEPED